MPVLVDQLASLPWSHVLSFLFLCCTTQEKEPCIDNTQFFEDELWPFLESDCLSCHQEGGAAGLSSFVLPSSPQDAEELVWNIGGKELSNTGTPLTLSKARGLSNHGGGMRIIQNSAQEGLIKEWNARSSEEVCSFERTPKPALRTVKPMTRLSPVQLKNTLIRAFGAEYTIDSIPAVYIQEAEYNNREGYTTAELFALKEYFTIIIQDIVNDMEECNSDSCVESWLFSRLTLLIRRPLSTSEKDIYRALLSSTENQDTGIKNALLVALLSPQFLYRNTIHNLDALPIEYQQLEEITYFLWDAPPTSELLDKLANNEWDPDMLTSLIDDPQTALAAARVHRDWLGAAKILGRRKDADQYPSFQRQQAEDILNEFLLFSQSSWEEEATLENLFTSRSGWINPTMADIYDIEQTPSSWSYTELPQERGGILSRAAVVSSHTTSLHNLIPHRGHMLIRRLLCQEYGLAPNSFSIDTLPPTEPMAAQDMIAMHQSNTVCATCHVHIDPIGLALESYDALGYWDSSIDTSGTFPTFSFSNIQDLQLQLVAQPELHQCYTQVWLERAQQRKLVETELSWAREQGSNMFVQQYSIPELLSVMIRTSILHEVPQ